MGDYSVPVVVAVAAWALLGLAVAGYTVRALRETAR